MPLALSTKNLAKTYSNKLEALKGVSVSVEEIFLLFWDQMVQARLQQ